MSENSKTNSQQKYKRLMAKCAYEAEILGNMESDSKRPSLPQRGRIPTVVRLK